MVVVTVNRYCKKALHSSKTANVHYLLHTNQQLHGNTVANEMVKLLEQ